MTLAGIVTDLQDFHGHLEDVTRLSLHGPLGQGCLQSMLSDALHVQPAMQHLTLFSPFNLAKCAGCISSLVDLQVLDFH